MRANRSWLRRYQRVFGWRGLFYFAYGEILGRTAEVTVFRSPAHAPVYLRLGTSDIGFFDEIFSRLEYDIPLAQPPQVIVDAGANIGLASRYFAEQYPDAQILAIEPSSANFKQLCKNVIGYPKITPIHAALGHAPGEVDVTNPIGRHGTFRTWSTTSSSAPVLERVPAVTIPDLLATYNLQMIDLLKLDIEGAEVELFANAASWINRVDAIAIELHDRFRRGCSLHFYGATQSFEKEWHQGELTCVAHARKDDAGSIGYAKREQAGV